MYITSILSFLSWPVLIYVTYRLVVYALNKYESPVEQA
jgi:hypothetical protein